MKALYFGNLLKLVTSRCDILGFLWVFEVEHVHIIDILNGEDEGIAQLLIFQRSLHKNLRNLTLFLTSKGAICVKISRLKVWSWT